MAGTTFVIDGEVDIEVTVTEVDGDLRFDLKVLETDGQIGDLNGFFIDLAGDCTDPAFTGDDVTGQGTDTLNLGGGVNLMAAGASPSIWPSSSAKPESAGTSPTSRRRRSRWTAPRT